MLKLEKISRAVVIVGVLGLFAAAFAQQKEPPAKSAEAKDETKPEADATDDVKASSKPARDTRTPFVPYAESAPAVEKWMHQMLDRPVRNLKFTGDNSLLEVLETIATQVTESAGDTPDGKMKMVVYPDVGEFALEQISSLDDVTVSDINFDSILLRNVLELIFDQTHDDSKSPVPLTYVIRNEVVMITTKDKAESADMLTTLAYNVPLLLKIGGQQVKLTDHPSTRQGFGGGAQGGGQGQGYFSIQFGGMGGHSAGEMGAAPDTDGEAVRDVMSLTQLVVGMTLNADGDNWTAPYGNGTVGQLQVFGDKLVISQTPRMQQRIADLLNLISEGLEN